jgi:hypothetical protein
VLLVDLGKRMSAGQPYYVSHVGDVRLRDDGVHFTATGARWVQPWLEARLRAALAWGG